MSNYLITGFHGTPHVTSENDRGIYASIFGKGRYILPVGEQFRCELIGDNTIRMYDGKLVDNGAIAGIPVGEYIDFEIPPVSQGKWRADYIAFVYSKNTSTQIETGYFGILQGTESTQILPDFPIPYHEDLLSGNAKLDQMPLVVLYVDARNGKQEIRFAKSAEPWSREPYPEDISSEFYENDNYMPDAGAFPMPVEVHTTVSKQGNLITGEISITSAFGVGDFQSIITINSKYAPRNFTVANLVVITSPAPGLYLPIFPTVAAYFNEDKLTIDSGNIAVEATMHISFSYLLNEEEI